MKQLHDGFALDRETVPERQRQAIKRKLEVRFAQTVREVVPVNEHRDKVRLNPIQFPASTSWGNNRATDKDR